MSFLDFLLAEAISAGLAHEATKDSRPPPKNFFVLPNDPTAWTRFSDASKKENMVVAMEFTNNAVGSSRAVQPLFIELARQFESLPFVRVEITSGSTYDELRKELGGVQITPTVLIILFHDEGKKIAKIEGASKIQIAVKSGAAEKTIRTFMEQRMKSKMAERLAGGLALRMAIGVAAANARRSAEMSREQQMREEFEKEMERELTQSVKRSNEPQIRELTDEEAKQEEEMQRKKKRAEQVSLLMQLDLDKLKEYELRNILRGMGIEVQGTKCAADLKKELVQNVPEMKSEMEARLKMLKAEKVQLDIEMDSLRAKLDTKERAIRDLELTLSP